MVKAHSTSKAYTYNYFKTQVKANFCNKTTITMEGVDYLKDITTTLLLLMTQV